MKRIIPLFIVISMILTGCGFAGEAYRNYVTAILDCTYHEEYQTYMELTNASIISAEAIYQAEEEALSERIRKRYGIKSDLISEELIQQYTDLAGVILKKTEYSVRDVLSTEDTYLVTLVIEPVDFWQTSAEDVETYYTDEFTPKYKRAPTRAAADRLEEQYASRVLEILTEHAENLAYLDPEVYTFTIENNQVSAQTWQEIDKLILNLN